MKPSGGFLKRYFRPSGRFAGESDDALGHHGACHLEEAGGVGAAHIVDVAVGLGADVIRTDGNQGRANGTSFASPIMSGMVACLWQACPELTAKEVIELVRRSGDRTDYPDNIYGYGVPDMWKAYQDYQSERNK